MMNPKEEIDELRRSLRHYNYLYYIKSAPAISDYEFDQKMARLMQLEKEYPQYDDPNSPTRRVGGGVSKSFHHVAHKDPMLSLQNTYSIEEVQEFFDRTEKALGEPFEIVCELKFDGLSISLIYENGQLIVGSTRGDGKMGDDVTNNIRTIRSIPLVLEGDFPPYVEARGEVLMPWKVFDKLNQEREADEDALFANPRNATSGTLKLKNSKIVAERGLDSFIYYLLGDDLDTKTQFGNLELARKLGFKVSNASKICKTIDEVNSFLSHWDIARKELPIATDGIVLKVNSLEQQEILGNTTKFPRWAIAYKFMPERELTQLESVSFQVGRTGVITPVANLKPILLSGSVVKRASLYNEDMIKSLDLHIGDYVYVEKGGEVIPKITGVEQNKRPANAQTIVFPTVCPACSTKLVKDEKEALSYCPNSDGCPPQIKGRLEHFAIRKAMNIGVGPETISLFYDKGLLHDVGDFYELKNKKTEILSFDRMGELSLKKILESIEKSKSVPYVRVLYALGIRYVGETVARRLAKAFTTFDQLKEADKEELMKVGNIGEKIAQSVCDYFSDPKHIQLIERLKGYGLQMSSDKNEQVVSNLLDGKHFVISGTFKQHSRDDYKAMIEENGGKNSSQVSKNTDFLLAGDNMGPAKKEKAEALGIKIIDENEFLSMLHM